MEEERTCSCRNKEKCPMGGQCLLENIIYQAKVTPLNTIDEGENPTPNSNLEEGDNPTPTSNLDEGDNPTPTPPTKPETYVGLCSTSFKARLSNHDTTFTYENKSNTTLSAHIWDLKKKNINYKIEWKILDRGQEYSPITGICSLCTCEKFQILFNPEKATLNHKKEIFGHCLHKKSKLLVKKEKKKSQGT